jgi:ABC-type transporter Mla MlaB component
MLKISEPLANHAVTLKLEGRLIGPWVAELKKSCEEHLAAKRSINLDFADVTFADRAGLALLLRLRSQGVTLVNCSPFMEEELRTATGEN